MRLRWREESPWVLTLLLVAAALPFVPGAIEFMRRGIPDVLFTGDGAAIELGTLHAAHGVQLVGPYSRFGWSHPGPAFFYLALPVYELFGQRGPALNLFAFVANFLVSIAIVSSARRLRGSLVAFAVAALLAVYILIALPFLVANEWNPIFPILPFTLLCFLALRFALGERQVLPVYVFVASVVVQTHVAFVPEVLATSVLAVGASGQRSSSDGRSERRLWLVTGAVALGMWALPLYEAATGHPGNLQLLVRFFVPKHWSEHTWGTATGTVFDQLAVMPLAVARAFRIDVDSARWPISTVAAVTQVVGLLALLASAVRRQDRTLKLMTVMVLVQIGMAILAVRAIRGDIEFYLVAWVSLLGFMSSVALIVWIAPFLRRRLGDVNGKGSIAIGAALLLGLALTEPVARGSVIRSRDVAVEQLARDVETYLRSAGVDHPTIRIPSAECWPSATATVLYLYKRGIPVGVEDRWITVVGSQFATIAGAHPELLFGNREFDETARSQHDLTFVANAPDIYVYLRR